MRCPRAIRTTDSTGGTATLEGGSEMILGISAVRSHRMNGPLMALAGLGFLGSLLCTSLVHAAVFELDESSSSVLVGDPNDRPASPGVELAETDSQPSGSIASSPLAPEASSSAVDTSGSGSTMIFDPAYGQSVASCTDGMPCGAPSSRPRSLSSG